jgi:hypothetical protein
MRRLLLVVLLLALAGTSQATDIKGKWGLGLYMGGLINSSGEAYLIRGKTERTAWIFDFSMDQGYSDTRDTSGRMTDLFQNFNISMGPRVRRYTRPQSKLSPYFDIYFSAGGGRERHYSTIDRGVTFQTGLAGGAEYFTPWHFSLAAHTGIFSISGTRGWHEDLFYQTQRSFHVNSGFSINPFLHVRVYF